ncbi:unnamed protein product [Owenia fusiformis]|uniref:Uncharacterized protein n=1 Tax=Owenia fusiformis TaxID=6347 RepID=A0A8J1V0J7_OWEFU|nr:unnamed protein product [Owenia fusiformis]
MLGSNMAQTKYNATGKWTQNTEDVINKKVGAICQPVRNLVFVKVAKCGGSTLTNIFQRYGEAHNLTFLLPKPNTSSIKQEDILEHIGKPVNMIVQHAQYNEELMKKLMPNDTVYIGLIREPLRHLKSLYNYKKLGNIPSMPTLAEFEENPWKYTHTNRMKSLMNNQSRWYGLKNFIKGKLNKDVNLTAKFVEKIAKQFDLILVTDHMKESLVLLKDVLCWTLDDMLFVSHKVANENIVNFNTGGLQESNEHTPNMDIAVKNMRRYSRVDYGMFDFFNYTLWERIKTKGDAFRNDLRQFEDKLRFLHSTCYYAKESLALSEEYIEKVVHEDTSSADYKCHRMLLPPTQYGHYIIRPKQDN